VTSVEVKIILERDIFAECIEELSKRKVILDLGGRRRFYKWLAPFKEKFASSHYFCLDILPNPNLDVVEDILFLPFASESADGIICHSVLEHVYEPQLAVKEISRVLKQGGGAFFYVPFLYHITEAKANQIAIALLRMLCSTCIEISPKYGCNRSTATSASRLGF